jgi:hypothetical protein
MITKPRTPTVPPPIAFFTIFMVGLLSAAGIKAIRDYATDLNQREIARVTSPDKQIDAVFVQPKVRLITSESDLYLVPKGEPAPSWGPVLQITKVSELPIVSWTPAGMLEFGYRHGCVKKFSNLWHSDDSILGERYVEVRLAPSSEMPCTGSLTIPVTSLKAAKSKEAPASRSIPRGDAEGQS